MNNEHNDSSKSEGLNKVRRGRLSTYIYVLGFTYNGYVSGPWKMKTIKTSCVWRITLGYLRDSCVDDTKNILMLLFIIIVILCFKMVLFIII